MDGILIVDKPAGVTSHDVVARIRRAAGIKKVGHAGTLDPLATGLLVLALGKATRTLQYLTGHDKGYQATVRLGESRDTYDAEGGVTGRHEGVLPERAAIETVLDHFQGEILQTPPSFSAIKQGGEPLYRKARRGESVEVAPRTVTIYHLAVTGWQPPDVVLSVHCSKGTYIRSLAHDIGERLGVGAHLAALRRTAIGPFRLEQAHPLDVLSEATPDGIAGRLLPLGAGLDSLPARVVNTQEQEALRHGRALPGEAAEGVMRAVNENGQLVAILRWQADRGWRPVKVFIS